MKVSIIVAMAKHRVIGKSNALPWKNIPADKKHFKKLTEGHPVIMGRKTYESIHKELGGPLPKRTNIVMTRSEDFSAEGCVVVRSFSHALSAAKELGGSRHVFIIGGEEIYRKALIFTDRLYITEINVLVDGDVHFPEINREKWKQVEVTEVPKSEDTPYRLRFLVYDKKSDESVLD